MLIEYTRVSAWTSSQYVCRCEAGHSTGHGTRLTHANNMTQSSRLNRFKMATLVVYLPAKKTVEIANSIHELKSSG